jgi:hypothetical protein
MNIKLIVAILLSQNIFSSINIYAQISATAATLNNCTTQIVTLTTSAGVSGGQYALATNQIVTLNNMGYATGGVGQYANVYFEYSNAIVNVYISNSGTSPNPALPITFTGLTSICLTNVANNPSSPVSATFTILTPSTNTAIYTPANSVVIPSDATGNVQIILQSSSDLVNWVPSLPGTYGSSYTNRFFRVVAVAQ